jgi:hypothetical protein
MTLRDDALYYRDMGWVTTPLINDDQGYPKKPFVDGWQRESLTDVPNLPWEERRSGLARPREWRNLAVIDLMMRSWPGRAVARVLRRATSSAPPGRGHLSSKMMAPASRVLGCRITGARSRSSSKQRATQVARHRRRALQHLAPWARPSMPHQRRARSPTSARGWTSTSRLRVALAIRHPGSTTCPSASAMMPSL